ncbi:hypothetical protein Tco_1156073 [Tanacetum coccineum]
MERNLGTGYSFVRKPCFVCGSLSHLIKDCDYYEKKMAREAALKSKRVVHTDDRQATPAWNNTNRVNKANQNMPCNSLLQIKSAASRFNTGKQHINSGCVNSNTARVNRPVSNKTSSKPSQGKMGTAVKTSAGCVWRKAIPLSNTNGGPTPDSTDHPRGIRSIEVFLIVGMVPGHMTGNRAHLKINQGNLQRGIVTFGGSEGCIVERYVIKKLHVLFTEKECYAVSSVSSCPDAGQEVRAVNTACYYLQQGYRSRETKESIIVISRQSNVCEILSRQFDLGDICPSFYVAHHSPGYPVRPDIMYCLSNVLFTFLHGDKSPIEFRSFFSDNVTLWLVSKSLEQGNSKR